MKYLQKNHLDDNLIEHEGSLFSGAVFSVTDDGIVNGYFTQNGEIISEYKNPLFAHLPLSTQRDTSVFVKENDWHSTPLILDDGPYNGIGFLFRDGFCVGEFYFEDDGYISDCLFRNIDGSIRGFTLYIDDLEIVWSSFNDGSTKSFSISDRGGMQFSYSFKESGELQWLKINQDPNNFLNQCPENKISPEWCSVNYPLDFPFHKRISMSGSFLWKELFKNEFNAKVFDSVEELSLLNVEFEEQAFRFLIQSGIKKIFIRGKGVEPTDVDKLLENASCSTEFVFSE